MNIYEKLQAMRVGLQNMNIKKSGKNSYAGYEYYELGDFLPAINQLMHSHKVTSIVSFGAEMATLTLVNVEKPDETIVFTSPMKDAVLKGAHPIQNLGAVETYSRRYLYMAAFEIVESDVLDSTNGAPQQNSGKPANTQPPVQKSKLSQDTSDKLNNALASYVKLTGYKMNDVIRDLQKEIGKGIKEFDENDAVKVLNLLENWQTTFMNNLGV